MFIDEATIYVKAGDGGNGCMSFRREKFVPKGGPDGGNGGRGGDIIFTASKHFRTLVEFHHKHHFKAQRGQHGKGSTKYGWNAEDLSVKVPRGTQIFDQDTGALLADLINDGDRVIAAKGGRGGRGNAKFATPTRQAPRFAEDGKPGEEKNLRLELKLIADVGLIGYPNVGKSTLISVISAAKPKIAAYPFTTLTPNLGVVRIDSERSFVVADIPGLIEGAHSGKGLGDKFLRHIERTSLLVHMIDGSGSEGRDPLTDFKQINHELKSYSPELAKKPQIVALNKLDLAENKLSFKAIKGKIEKLGYETHLISAVTHAGVKDLVEAVARSLISIS
jgi:GTP-binding protein